MKYLKYKTEHIFFLESDEDQRIRFVTAGNACDHFCWNAV